MKPTSLGGRMKDHYEDRYRIRLPRRNNTVVRLDGKAFHTYTKGLERPYDTVFMRDMTAAAQFVAENVQGCKLSYVQSDEISLVLTDYGSETTDAWFDGNLQKIVSITASYATGVFNQLRPYGDAHMKLGFFDSRAFVIPELDEVINYLVWRQQDCTRNSIQMLGQNHFSHKQLHLKNTDQVQEMLHTEHGVNWNDQDPRFKRGTLIVPVTKVGPVGYTDKRTGEKRVAADAERRWWEPVPAPKFTGRRGWLMDRIEGLKIGPDDLKVVTDDE